MKKYKVTVNGTAYEITLEEIDASSAAPAAAAAPAPAPAQNASADGKSVNSPMPGTILAINVTGGQQVRKGDVLMVLEAMKMENEIMSPCDGKIASIQVTKGSSVESGTVLCTIA